MPSFGRGIGQPAAGSSQYHFATAAASSGYGPLGTAHPHMPLSYAHVVPTRLPQLCPAGTLANVAGHELGFGGVWQSAGSLMIQLPFAHCPVQLQLKFGSFPHSHQSPSFEHESFCFGGALGQYVPASLPCDESVPPSSIGSSVTPPHATSPTKRRTSRFMLETFCNRETTHFSRDSRERRAPLCAVYCERCPTIAPTSRRLPGSGGSLG